MKMVGRKIFLSWGENTVVAIEKLAVSPEEFGMKKPSQMSKGPYKERDPGEYIQLADVIDMFGERVVRDFRTPACPTILGSEIDRFFTDRGNWLDENDLEPMEVKDHSE